MHTGPGTRSMIRGLGVAAVGVAAAAALAGCAVAAAPAATDPAAAHTATAVSPEETCAQLIDVGTLLHNEGVAHAEGRIADVEYAAAQQLVGRMVHRVDVTPGTPLAEAVATLEIVVGPYTPGHGATTFDATSEQWRAVFADARDECTRAGVQFYAEGWSGG